MKIIELLTLIAKGEEVPKEIKWRNGIYKYNFRWKDYKKEVGEVYFFQTILNRNCDMLLILNDEVEIIEEEKEIEKFKEHNLINTRDILELQMFINKKFADYDYKINELIDVINDMRDEEC